ncbi:hypothetical protein Glove_606g162 [Diversispora epigaea]|uniref:Uncharacterized protein n=1 Tax=Diversispora epigaea TaxID=1348612 RepID=A0A397GBS4_9GLOM|nr:hypothetical protein Glove_606g162 [Diversispora epigaea]
MCKFPSRPWDIRNQERCTEENLALFRNFWKRLATEDIKKGIIFLDEKPLISVHIPGQQLCDFCNKPISSKKIYGLCISLLIVLKIFAIAKQRDICPLDIEEIKHLFPFQHSTAWFQHETGQLYLIISLFNHHCDPNASHTDDVSRAIQRGDPFVFSLFFQHKSKYLLITWNDLSMLGNTSGSTKHARQTLETTHGFRCRCSFSSY